MRPKPLQPLQYLVLAGLLAVCYLVFFHALGGVGLIGRDEPRYAGVARAMYETDDYITPRLLGEAWFEKPVLLYWLEALGYAIFGVGEVGARLPSAVAATASVLLLYWYGCRVWNRGAGLVAALILATSAGFIGLARAASTDMLLAGALTAALVLFLVGSDSEEGDVRRRYFYGFYAALGLGVLAKGPVALLLPLLSLGVFYLWRGTPGEWRRWHPKGLLVTVLVAAPWYLAVTWANGWPFVEEFLLNHNLLRFLTDRFEHEGPFYFYFPVLVLMMFPWAPLLIPALTHRRYARNECLILAWAVVPFVFFSFSASKLPAYILPVAAPIALLCATEIGSEHNESRIYRLAVLFQALFWALFGSVMGLYPGAIGFDVPLGGVVFFVAMMSVAAAIVLVGLRLPPPNLVVLNIVAVLSLVVLITNSVFPRIQSVESMRPWDHELGRLVTSGEAVFLYKPTPWMEYGLEFYRARPIQSLFTEDELAQVAESRPRTLCIAPTPVLDELSAGNSVAIDVVSSLGNQTAFWIYKP